MSVLYSNCDYWGEISSRYLVTDCRVRRGGGEVPTLFLSSTSTIEIITDGTILTTHQVVTTIEAVFQRVSS